MTQMEALKSFWSSSTNPIYWKSCKNHKKIWKSHNDEKSNFPCSILSCQAFTSSAARGRESEYFAQ